MRRRVLTGVYRREGDWNLVELKLSDPAQLFNSLDPSPFRERELEAGAAAYLVDVWLCARLAELPVEIRSG